MLGFHRCGGLLLVGIGVLAASSQPVVAQLGTYHNYAQTTAALQDFAAAYPKLVEVGTLGQSVLGKEIWYARITDNLDAQEDEPEFRYISTMHGDEVVGTEMSLYFIDHLLSNYGGSDQLGQRITDLVNGTDITIVPLMNPDGRDFGRRYNANWVDLNRAFPEGSHTNIGNVLDGPSMDLAGREAEVQAVMEWSAANRFTLSANLHGGTLVVNYPYDNDGLGSTFSPAPDDDLFIEVSKRYSVHNEPMWNSPWFEDGITNGAEWYAIDGGLQDWAYRYLGDNHVTIELSYDKWPSASLLPAYWDDNRESMLSFAEQVHIGVRGLMTDEATGQPIEGTVEVLGNERTVFSDPDIGDYHRMLLPGAYDLRFTASGYNSVTVEGVVVADGATTRLDILMQSISTLEAADFDGDGDVDGDDFLVWQSSFGTSALGDADADGDTDGDDFLVWQSQFGSGSGGAGTVIPEPGSLMLLTGIALAISSVGRRSPNATRC